MSSKKNKRRRARRKAANRARLNAKAKTFAVGVLEQYGLGPWAKAQGPGVLYQWPVPGAKA